MGQSKTNVYLFPGQGSDRRIFDSLHFDEKYQLNFVDYGCPDKHQSMQDFAKTLLSEIDASKEFILIGVSLGGMICAELAELVDAKKVIVISSAKNRNELPLRYRFQRILPLYRLVPPQLMLWGAKFMQPLVEPDRNKNKETFVAMLGSKKALYMKRTVGMIIHWNKKSNSKKIVHIHGRKDHTLPFRKIKAPDYVVVEGSHMMTLTGAVEINVLLQQILLERSD